MDIRLLGCAKQALICHLWALMAIFQYLLTFYCPKTYLLIRGNNWNGNWYWKSILLLPLRSPLSAGSQGSLSRILPARTLCSTLHLASLQLIHHLYPERSRVGRRGSGSSAGLLRLPVAQWRPQHGAHSPVRLLSAVGTVWLALSRRSHNDDTLPGPVFPVLLRDGVHVCRECFRGPGRCDPQPPVACSSESRNKHFRSTYFSGGNWGTHQVAFKRFHVCRLLGLHTGPQQVSVGCHWPM